MPFLITFFFFSFSAQLGLLVSLTIGPPYLLIVARIARFLRPFLKKSVVSFDILFQFPVLSD